jgi:hypothetical protein
MKPGRERPAIGRRQWRRRIVMLAAVWWLAASVSAIAEFRIGDLDNISVDRLVANLESLIEKEPRSAELRANLARVHAMAYATKSSDARIVPGREREGVWTGHEPNYLQPRVKGASGKTAEVARAHLSKAIVRYDEALELAPDNLMARLGLGWCLIQSGDKARATTALREVVARSWPADRDPGRGRLHDTVTEEAARYLTPLLDPAKDKAELDLLRQRVDELEKMPRAFTPIAIPLRDGLGTAEIIDHDANIRFDADGSGVKRRWTWITRDAAWLVYDQTGTKRIDSALQLFGSVAFWLFWENGYHALRVLDDDGDGRVAGNELRHLALWQDRNGNAKSEPAEVKPVSYWRITALSYAYQLDATHPDEMAFAPAGVMFSDGSSRPTFDVVLHTR